MEENWISIEGDLLNIKDLPQQLKDLNLMPIFLRRYFENIFIKDIKADKDEQIAFQQKFMKKEGIGNKDELEIWLKNNLITEKEISRQLYVNLRLEKFKKEKFGNKIEDVFLKRKKSLDRVTYSLLRVKNRSTISELYIKINSINN